MLDPGQCRHVCAAVGERRWGHDQAIPKAAGSDAHQSQRQPDVHRAEGTDPDGGTARTGTASCPVLRPPAVALTESTGPVGLMMASPRPFMAGKESTW